MDNYRATTNFRRNSTIFFRWKSKFILLDLQTIFCWTEKSFDKNNNLKFSLSKKSQSYFVEWPITKCWRSTRSYWWLCPKYNNSNTMEGASYRLQKEFQNLQKFEKIGNFENLKKSANLERSGTFCPNGGKDNVGTGNVRVAVPNNVYHDNFNWYCRKRLGCPLNKKTGKSTFWS